MVRWVKIAGDQYLGFWALGLVLFAIQEIPYMLMPLFHLERNPIMNMTETSTALDMCEKILGSLCIALMVFVIHEKAIVFSVSNGREKLFFTLAAVILLANFFGWALYFTGHQSTFVMMLFIVAMPPLYYVERRIVSGTGDELFSGDYCYKTTHFWRNDMKHTA